MRRQVTYCVFLMMMMMFVFGAVEADTKPIVIFRPGEFFDPFTENNQPKASQVKPDVVFAEPSTFFSQPVKPSGFVVGYPRSIGHTSGNAAEFNAQLFQPNTFSLNHISPVYKRTENNTPKPHSRLVDTQPKSTALRSRKINKPSEHVPAQAAYTKSPKSSVASAQASNVAGDATKLVAQATELEAHPSSHSASKSAEAGEKEAAGFNKSHGDKEVKEYKSNHHHSTGDHAKHVDHHKKSHHKEKGGKESKHHDEAGHYKKYHEGKKSHKAAKFGEKKGHKRGHKTKGYHNKFHRDEYHREHRFYDDYNKEGYHEKHGDTRSHYKKKEGGHKSGGGHSSGHSAKKFGKKNHSKKGKHVDDNKGFNREGGSKKYHKHHRDHHKKHDNAKGKKYGYHKEN